MLKLKWNSGIPSHGKKEEKNRFGFEPIRYQMQTNMIGRVLNGYTCGGCSKK
jgi:hypothetical protein